MSKELLIFCILSFIFFGCEKTKKENPEITKLQVDLKFEHLENELFQIKDTTTMKAFLKAHPIFSREYLELENASEDPQMVEFMLNLYSNDGLKHFNKEVREFYNQPSSLSDQLENMFKHIKYYDPNYYVPEVNTIVTGFKFNKDLAVSDSLIVISTDYFLGDSASYRPESYQYFLDRYKKEYIIPMITMALSNKYNEVNTKDETMLAHMIYHGKTLYFMETMMPLAHDSLIIMYTGQQLKEIDENLGTIWSHFIENQLFFDTKPKSIERYIGESPKISAIGENCPGRIGRWLGWQIVRKYMDNHPEISFQELMQEQNAQKIFKESNYKPKQGLF